MTRETMTRATPTQRPHSRHTDPRRRSSRRGAALLASLVLIVGICMLAAVMVDLGYLHACKSRMQNAADAAALAATMRLSNENTAAAREEAKNWAIGFANHNLEGFGDVLVPDDVVFGNWNPTSESFVENNSSPNSVQIMVRRDGKNTASVGGFFMNIFGTSEIAMTATATATISGASGAEGVPMALRSPDFGDVNAKLTDHNPLKDGPSSPANGTAFEVGEQVVIAVEGDGKDSSSQLTLAIDEKGPGAPEGHVKDVLKGKSDPVDMQVGDEASVMDHGMGDGKFTDALEDRMKLPDSHADRDLVMPIVEEVAGSRNGKGELTGNVRIADFVSVHLDDIVEEQMPDPKNAKKTITVRYFMGTITNKRAETSWGGATPSGAGGSSVGLPELVK